MSSSVMIMKLFLLLLKFVGGGFDLADASHVGGKEEAFGMGRLRPSRAARACERLCLRTRVDTVEALALVMEDMRFGSGRGPMTQVREMLNCTREGEGRSSSRAGRRGREGKRGGVGGSCGRVIDGAGLGEGIERRESREKWLRRGETVGTNSRCSEV